MKRDAWGVVGVNQSPAILAATRARLRRGELRPRCTCPRSVSDRSRPTDTLEWASGEGWCGGALPDVADEHWVASRNASTTTTRINLDAGHLAST